MARNQKSPPRAERPRPDRPAPARPRSGRPRAARWRGLALVALVSLAANLAYLAQSRHDPTFAYPVLDAQTYDQQARLIAAGQPVSRDPFWQPPLYPYWLAAVYRTSAGSIPAAKLLQALLGVGTCLLTVALGRRLFGEGVAIGAGLIAALYGPLIFYDLQLLPAGLGTLLCLAAFLLLLRAAARPAPAAWFAYGVATGLAALTVGNALVLAPLAAFWLLAGRAVERSEAPAAGEPAERAAAPAAGEAAGRASVRSAGARWRALAVLLAGLAAGVAPAAIHNYAVARQLVPISTNGGVNLYLGNNPDAWRTVAIRPGYDWVELTRLPNRHGVTRPAAQSAWFARQVLAYAAGDPAGFVRGLLVKARLFLNARELPRNTDLYVHASYAPLLRALAWRAGSFAFPFGVVAPLALLGLVTGCRRGGGGRWLAAGFLALYGASIVLFFVAARYRVVLTPFLAVFAAAGAAWLWERRRAARPLAGGLAIVGVVGVLANLPVRAPTDGRNFAADLHFLVGVRAETNQQFAEASAAYAKALQIDPNHADAWLCLGNLRRRQGDLDRAIQAYARATGVDPQYAEAHNNLASVLLDRGQLREAIAEARQAIRLRPESANPYQNLGIALLRSGRAAAAADTLRRCVALDSTMAEACGQLAWLLATDPEVALRRGPEAVRLAERLARATPDPAPGALDILGAAYAEAGRFDAALAAAQRAQAKAAAAGQAELEAQIRQRLLGYQDRRPYRDLSLGAPAPAP